MTSAKAEKISSIPYADDWLHAEAATGGRAVLSGGVKEQREQFDALGEALGGKLPPLPDTLDVEDVQITLGVRGRVYAPKDRKWELPIGVYFHPGGFIMGNLESDDYFCRLIALFSNVVIVAVDYRLAPEHVFPAAVDDCEAGFNWAFEHASKYGATTSKLFTIGASAGGNLAIGTALRILSSPNPSRVKGVVALAPAVVFAPAIPERYQGRIRRDESPDSAIINEDSLATYLDAYKAPPSDPYFSVLLHPKLNELPPAYLVGCEKDPQRDDCLVFEKELKRLGRKVSLDFYKGYPHCFWVLPGTEVGQKFLANLVAGIEWVVENIEG